MLLGQLCSPGINIGGRAPYGSWERFMSGFYVYAVPPGRTAKGSQRRGQRTVTLLYALVHHDAPWGAVWTKILARAGELA